VYLYTHLYAVNTDMDGLIGSHHCDTLGMNTPAHACISHLPNELLSEIFSQALDTNIYASNKLVHDGFRSYLMGVCRRWRDIVLSSPSFWTNYDVSVTQDAEYDSDDDPDVLPVPESLLEQILTKIDRCLSRSQQHPLNVKISIGFYAEDDDPLLLLFCSLSNRWRKLHIDCSSSNFPQEMVETLQGSLPALQDIGILGGTYYNGPEDLMKHAQSTWTFKCISPDFLGSPPAECIQDATMSLCTSSLNYLQDTRRLRRLKVPIGD
jgi:hypothetical protein